MAIANDWYIDYYNKLICHSTHSIAYDGELVTFVAGQTIGNATPTPTKTAIIVKVLDNGTDGTLDLVYVNGSWANNDPIYVGAVKYADASADMVVKTTTYTTECSTIGRCVIESNILIFFFSNNVLTCSCEERSRGNLI